jgi:hypothetical protein
VVSLYASDTLVSATLADIKGVFEFIEMKKGNYLLIISDTVYQTVSDSVTLNSDQHKRYVLRRQISLDEVTIVADRSNVVEQTANGAIFKLSSSAKKANNVFAALSEIPLLVVDETNRKVGMSNGSTPLILINGIPRGNGLNGIDPEDVESVEVIEVPSARYVSGSVTAVVNLKMSRKQYDYRLLNASTRHSVPGEFGYSSMDVETGNTKRLVYLTGSHFYFSDDESRYLSSQQNSGYSKNSETTGFYNSNSWYVCLGGDHVFSEDDYLSYSITYISNPSDTKQNGSGELASGNIRSVFDISTNRENSYYVNTYNAYYKHGFRNKSQLETTFRLNFNGNQNKGETRETYDNRPQYHYLFNYDNSRTSSSFDLNYSFSWLGQSSNVGSGTKFRKDKINHISSPIFNYRELDEYLYVDASNSLNEHFSYMASIGADLIFNRSGDKNNSYCSPTATAAITYRADSYNSMRLSYLKNNNAPDIGYMNPYNTSSDSLLVSIGNPYLQPVHRQKFAYGYTFNKSGIYLSPQVSYLTVSNYIVPWGSNDGRVYTQTYINDEHFSELDGMFSLRYNRKWGSIGGSAGYRHTYFSNIDKGTFYTNVNFNARYKKVFANGYVMYQKYSFTPFMTTKQYTPESEITFGLRPNSIITFQAGMRYFLGGLKMETHQNDKGYLMDSTQENLDRKYLIMLGLNINLKSETQKNRPEKRLYQNESGINLNK